MITDEDRARLGGLAMRAIDSIIEQYGDDAQLEDALIVYEISLPDQEHGEPHRETEIGSECTSYRATIAGGLAQAYAHTQLFAFVPGSEEPEGD